MKILVFDTETTGLPIGRNPSVITTSRWPYIVQLSYVLYDTSTHKILKSVDTLIKIPLGVNISQDSIQIHKITKEMTQKKGISINMALEQFNKCLLDADIIVGHNVSFDKNIITVECVRNKLSHNFHKNGSHKPEYCTMKNGADLCKIIAVSSFSGIEYTKYPKLNELYKHLFGYIPDGLHNAMIDVLICLRCYGKMTGGIDFCTVSCDLSLLFNKYSISVCSNLDHDDGNDNGSSSRRVKQKITP